MGEGIRVQETAARERTLNQVELLQVFCPALIWWRYSIFPMNKVSAAQ